MKRHALGTALLRKAPALTPQICILFSLQVTLAAHGADVPFTERVISTTAIDAVSVFAIDLDGDGDIDVLSATQGDSNLAWYENDGGSPPSFTERVISTTAYNGTSVYATDVDGDGIVDVFSLAGGRLTWNENDG